MSRQYTIPLRFQVLAISLVGVVAFLLVGGFAAFNQRSIDDARAAQEQALEANLKVTRAGLTFEAARGLGQRFIAERRPELARGEGEAMAQALALLAAAQEAGGDARMAGEIAELRRLVEVYSHDFATVRAALADSALARRLERRLRRAARTASAPPS